MERSPSHGLVFSRIALARRAALGLAVSALAVSSCARPASGPSNELDAKVTIVDSEQPQDGKTPMVVQFFERGTLVELVDGASATCNGVALEWNGLGYVARVPQVAPGADYQLAHTHEGITTTLRVTAPPRPVITSPTPGALVPRSAATVLRYTAAGAVRVRASATGVGGGAVRGEPQDDSGVANLDVRSLAVGAGTMSLTRELEGKVRDTSFHSASFSYAVEKQVPVVWQ
ncbi:MAG: hypothetical protein R3B48_16130 [Kofleriaceae bacterium]